MKSTKFIIFFLMIFIYIAGVFVGAKRELNSPEQAKMYEYLEKSVSEYNVGVKEAVKSVAKENAKSLALLAIGGFFKPLCFVVALVALSRGYTAGFSIMAILHLYGVKGILLCGANLVSVAITVPTISYYAGIVFSEMFIEKLPQKELYKKVFVILLVLTVILCADCLVKGFLSPLFMKCT